MLEQGELWVSGGDWPASVGAITGKPREEAQTVCKRLDWGQGVLAYPHSFVPLAKTRKGSEAE